ncbi:FGGY-family carbohydrate kinase [Herbaspirillum lusitanum]|uniref:FGGY-family carbohydrate kinase n=1 Tax=Herbaspirillum lusitanum TaxID=213312 RepID=UPI0002E03DD1|nr:FGGY family carbohydrate kinase [Herbaspirillum lusitanum]
MIDALAVFDIGKTNIKLSLVDAQGHELAVRRRANEVVQGGFYPHHDVDAIEAWLLSTLSELAQQAYISAIVPVTHGATAALVDEHGLVLPIADYEQSFRTSSPSPEYEALRPAFDHTFSPSLGLGLNLGRQLYWLQQTYPETFGRAHRLLMYPQYWAWRLCGVAAAEVTSLGCHTDLWQPSDGTYSSIVASCGWTQLMPSLHPAWAELGCLHPHLVRQTGLPSDCRILCGIHDSNASLLRYLDRSDNGPRVVLSTGTWLIAAALDGGLDCLREQSDMLANVNARGEAVACMRFMGGREFAELAGSTPHVCNEADLQALVDSQSMALPCFSGCGGPFAGRQGHISGSVPETAAGRYALATLYCVLMTEYCLEHLQASGPVVVEGSFTANPYFAPLLAATSGGREVFCSEDGSGTTMGGWILRHWREHPHGAALPAPKAVAPLRLRGWESYRQAWRHAVTPLLRNEDIPFF